MPSSPTIQILLIEDDAFLARLITTKLEKEGFRVVGVQNGEEGLKQLETNTPDLILLDLVLPGIDGFEVLKKVKSADAPTKSVPVIILSNLGEEEYVTRGLGLGAEDYLVKSNFTTDEIVRKIFSVLGKK